MLNGEMLMNLLNSYVEMINKGAVPVIQSAWTYMCQNECVKAQENSIELYNKKFKELAEAHGLICEYTGGAYGWNTTAKNNDKLIEYALEKGYTELQIARRSSRPIRIGVGGTAQQGGSRGLQQGEKRPSSTRKLICPGGCGQTVRATKKVNIICGCCMVPMIEVE